MRPVNFRPQWIEEKQAQINAGTLDHTTTLTQAIQKLIVMSVASGKTFRVWNLGAGVRRITSQADVCPCCRRVLES